MSYVQYISINTHLVCMFNNNTVSRLRSREPSSTFGPDLGTCACSPSMRKPIVCVEYTKQYAIDPAKQLRHHHDTYQ